MLGRVRVSLGAQLVAHGVTRPGPCSPRPGVANHFLIPDGSCGFVLEHCPGQTCHNSPGGHESSVSGVFVEDLRVGEPDGGYLQSSFGCVQKPAGRMQVDFMPISGDCFVI